VQIVKEISVKLQIRDDGWILCSPEVTGFLLQVADSLMNQAIYTAEQEELAKPKIVLAT
jgi:hypothetical protein